MRVDTVNGIICAVNAIVTMCSVRTCQHSYMTDDQHSEYKAAIQKEYNRKHSEYKATIQKEYNRKQSLAPKKKA